MTREEIGELVTALPQGLDADEFVYKLVNWAVDRERERIVNLLMIQHDAAKGRHNYWQVAANLIQAEG